MNFGLRLTQICILIFFILPKNLHYHHHSNLFVIWNVGYGGWSTWMTENTCKHFDLGGQNFKFKLSLLYSCLQYQNFFYLTQNDRYHLRFKFLFKNLFQPNCLGTDFFIKSSKHLQPNDPLDPCLIQFQPIWCIKKFAVTTVGHLKTNFYKADCNKLLILPGHGSKSYIQQKNILQFLKYKMLVTSTQSRKTHHDLKTEALFKKYGRKLIYTHVWGHLVLQGRRQRTLRPQTVN